ncbi:MAG: hypothetical protein IT303_14625 [Dehalococcoidia bacterium]|nr:hypothetical protein [Dehalococcoidia bacterium]
MSVPRAVVALFVSIIAAGAVACGGGGSPATIPGIAEATAERDVQDGAALTTSTITVRFDRNFELAERKVPLASMFEIEVEGDDEIGTSDRRVLVKEAERTGDTSRTIELEVDALIPDGATLRVKEAAFKAGAKGELTAEIGSELLEGGIVLATNAFAPQRAELFEILAAPPVPAAADRDAAVQRSALEAHLEARGSDAETVDRALERYDTMDANVVPSPKLRAALAALLGSFAEPAVDSLLTADNCTGKPAAAVVFQEPPEYPDLLARVTFTRDGARVVSVRPDLEGERFERFMPLLAHEAVHCDQSGGRIEEIAATAFDTLLYMQLVAVDPGLVEGGTQLAVEMNIDTVALFNSGRRYPESAGLLPSEGSGVALPGTNTAYSSFAELVADAYSGLPNESPDEPLAQAYVQLLAQGTGMGPGSAFDLFYLDELLGRAVPFEVLGAVYETFALAPVG